MYILQFYEGTFEDAVGTYMFFEKENKKPVEDEFETEPNIKYVAKTRKVLKMERIFVTPKNQDESIVNIDNTDNNCENTHDFEEHEQDEQDQHGG